MHTKLSTTLNCIALACLLILPSVDLELLWQWLSLRSGCNKSLSSELPFEQVRVLLLSFYWAGVFLTFVCSMSLTLCYLLATSAIFTTRGQRLNFYLDKDATPCGQIQPKVHVTQCWDTLLEDMIQWHVCLKSIALELLIQQSFRYHVNN